MADGQITFLWCLYFLGVGYKAGSGITALKANQETEVLWSGIFWIVFLVTLAIWPIIEFFRLLYFACKGWW